jgi:hypothetical protein
LIVDLHVYSQINFLRKTYGSRLNIFAPVNDLSLLSRSGTEDKSLVAGQKNDVEIAGGQLLGDEYSDHVVKVRSLNNVPLGLINCRRIGVESFCEKGTSASCVCNVFDFLCPSNSTLLKSDQWLSESHRVFDSVRGAINFRNIPGTNIYASGQPTESAIDEVVHRVKEAHPDANKVVWVTLREEPIVYVNGAPYCLRRERFSLRNMKGLRAQLLGLIMFLKEWTVIDYGGISASRLEVLEERLKDDVLAELEAFGGRWVFVYSQFQTIIHIPGNTMKVTSSH